jgi:hypothetical protein
MKHNVAWNVGEFEHVPERNAWEWRRRHQRAWGGPRAYVVISTFNAFTIDYEPIHVYTTLCLLALDDGTIWYAYEHVTVSV